MNTQNNLGIWISDPADISKISQIIQNIPDVDDVFIITENTIYTTDYAVVSPFYVAFYNAKIAFLSVQDLLSNKSKIRSQEIYLVSNLSHIIENDVSKKMLSDVRVISL